MACCFLLIDIRQNILTDKNKKKLPFYYKPTHSPDTHTHIEQMFHLMGEQQEENSIQFGPGSDRTSSDRGKR